MAHTPSHNSSASQNLNFQQDLISGFGNLPLGYAQGAFTLQDLADYVFPAAYEKIDTSTFNPEATAALLDQILLQAVGSDESPAYQAAQELVSDVAAGTVDPELAASTLLLTEEGQQLSMMNPAFGEAIQGVFASASKMGEDSRALQTGDVVQFDDGFYRRRSDKERNDLLADVGLDNALSNPDLYGFERRQRELSGVDDFIRRFAAEESGAAERLQKTNRELSEAEDLLAQFNEMRANRPESRAATGARRPVQNAGIAALAGIEPGRKVDPTVYDENFQENLLAEAMNRNAAVAPYAQGAELVPSPGVMGAGGSVPLTTSGRPVSEPTTPDRGRTISSGPPVTEKDIRRLRDEARDLENRQKMAAAQRKQQEMIKGLLEDTPGRYTAPASQLLNEGLSQMGAAVAPAPRVSKPKIKLDSDTIARLVRGG